MADTAIDPSKVKWDSAIDPSKVKWDSVNPQQMAQQASQMPTGQQMQVPQMQVNPGMGFGMNTMDSIQKNAALVPYANQKAIDANIGLQETQKKAELQSQQNFGQTDNMVDNLISSVKGAYAQSAGGGLIKGTAGNIASMMHLDNTGDISGLRTTARDTAAAYAKVLTGGSRGVLGMFNRVLETIPHDATPNPEQAGTALMEMYLTGAALEKGIKNGGLTPDQLKKMSTDDVQNWVKTNSLSSGEQQQIYKNMATKFQSIAPRPQIDIYGNVKPPQPNVLSKFASDMMQHFGKAPSAKVQMTDPQGNKFMVANSEADEAIKHGWKK